MYGSTNKQLIHFQNCFSFATGRNKEWFFFYFISNLSEDNITLCHHQQVARDLSVLLEYTGAGGIPCQSTKCNFIMCVYAVNNAKMIGPNFFLRT